MSLALPMGTRESCPLLHIWFLLILALTFRLVFHHPFLPINQTCLLCLIQIYTSTFRGTTYSAPQMFDELHCSNWYPSYISITFLLASFASQCNSLKQYFLRTNNIFRWKRFMVCRRHWKNKFKNIYNQSPLVDFFWKLSPVQRREESAASTDCK
jgi:hypothetical protein